jgi:hypothetical protein
LPSALRGLVGHVEVGIAFERELFYRDGLTDTFRPNPNVLLGGGVFF